MIDQNPPSGDGEPKAADQDAEGVANRDDVHVHVVSDVVAELEAASEVEDLRRVSGKSKQVVGQEKLDTQLGPHSDVPEGP